MSLKKAIKDSSEATAKQTLLRWCKEITSSNANVSVNNFYSSFSDGLALCTILVSKPYFVLLSHECSL